MLLATRGKCRPVKCNVNNAVVAMCDVQMPLQWDTSVANTTVIAALRAYECEGRRGGGGSCINSLLFVIGGYNIDVTLVIFTR
jgi:hypothetical protein